MGKIFWVRLGPSVVRSNTVGLGWAEGWGRHATLKRRKRGDMGGGEEKVEFSDDKAGRERRLHTRGPDWKSQQSPYGTTSIPEATRTDPKTDGHLP